MRDVRLNVQSQTWPLSVYNRVGAPTVCRTHQTHWDLRTAAFNQARYCSSLTFSIQSTALPSSRSWMAMCVIAVVGVAPCQCFSPGGNQTTSPGLISSIGPPQRCAHPSPDVTISV